MRAFVREWDISSFTNNNNIFHVNCSFFIENLKFLRGKELKWNIRTDRWVINLITCNDLANSYWILGQLCKIFICPYWIKSRCLLDYLSIDIYSNAANLMMLITMQKTRELELQVSTWQFNVFQANEIRFNSPNCELFFCIFFFNTKTIPKSCLAA